MLTTPERDSLIGAAILVLVCISQRKHLFALTTLGFFFLANLISGFIGVLLLPWALDGVILGETFRFGFGFIDWNMIDAQDLSDTIWLYVGGFLFFLVGHRVATLMRPARRKNEPPPVTRVLDTGRLAVLTAAALIFDCVYVALNPAVYLAGVESQLLGADKSQLVIYRYASVTNYGFVLVTFNVLPFLSTALWQRTRSKPTFSTLGFSLFAVLITAVMLILTFQKLPLMVFAIALACTEVANSQRKQAGAAPGARRPWVLRSAALLFGLLAIISTLQSALKGGEKGASPVLASVLEIFGRISVGAPMFVHYFPKIEPYYGLSSVGMVANLMGDKLYECTAVVFRYFTHEDTGSGALGAILDFYCAFGWVGWAIGSFLLGVLLAQIDALISRLPTGESRVMALIFAFTFCVHLGQASIFNAAFGYGGIFFLVLWLVIFPQQSTARRRLLSEPAR